MLTPLHLLRRLAEQHDYQALHDACLEADVRQPAVQILLALAFVHLGDIVSGRRVLEGLDPAGLAADEQVDLAALHIAVGELDAAVNLLSTVAAAPEDLDAESHARLLARLAWCRLQQGETGEAMTLYEQSLTRKPLLAAYHTLLRLYLDQHRVEDAARCLKAAQSFWSQARALWPEAERQVHDQLFRQRQLDLWLAGAQTELAEDWLQNQRETLAETDWCALVALLAHRLSERDRHDRAEEWLRTALQHYPEHLPLLSQLAEIAQLQGRSRQAIGLWRRYAHLAEAAGKPAVTAWLRISGAALSANPRLARTAVAHARETLQRHVARPAGEPLETAEWAAGIEVALAEVEVQERQFDAAEARFQRVLTKRPGMVACLQGLGRLYMQLGRIDDAVALFDRIRAIDPSVGYAGLIHARQFPEDEETLERLEKLARTPGMEGSLRAGLLFQLAACWDKRADYDRAFTLADEANQATRRKLSYDPAAHRQHCARIRHAFARDLFEHRPGCGHRSRLPVFVVGMPRSGTTLVEQIIAGHSRIHGAGELGTIPRVIAGLERWERHTGSGRRYPDCVDDLDPVVVNGIAKGILKELQEYAPEADHVVDKLPHNFQNIGLIKLLFPQAKIISVRRDPRDVAISSFFNDFAARHSGMGYTYDLDWIGEQLGDHNLLMHHWHQLFPGEILEVHYEDLVDDPEPSARRLLEYIGVEWEPQVLEFHKLDRPVKTASVWQVRQPLYASAKANWRRYENHIAPLIAGTNRKITWSPIEMITLPEPGWLNLGVDCYREGNLDGAEYRFRQMLQFLPEHAAASFMLGLVAVRKGHLENGIELMEKALQICPWKDRWRDDLARLYQSIGQEEKAEALLAAAQKKHAPGAQTSTAGQDVAANLDFLFLSGETTCSDLEPEKSVKHR